jgi:hypothetical protein
MTGDAARIEVSPNGQPRKINIAVKRHEAHPLRPAIQKIVAIGNSHNRMKTNNVAIPGISAYPGTIHVPKRGNPNQN